MFKHIFQVQPARAFCTKSTDGEKQIADTLKQRFPTASNIKVEDISGN